MIVRSRNGYNKSGLYGISGSADDILDVEDDGKIVGEITSKQLKGHLYRCKRSGKEPKYTNIRSGVYIIDPDYKPIVNRPLFSAGVYKSGVDFQARAYGAQDQVTCTKVPHGQVCDYVFEFANEFTIAICSFRAQINYGDYSFAWFKLFGVEESLGFEANLSFSVALVIYEYEPDYIRGQVMVTNEFSDTQDYQNGYVRPWKLGDFELRRTGTVYKGVSSDVVYNRVRYVKERVLDG